ncbi:Mn2+/Fe2+ NRAMP family transporter [Kribbella sp. VKM Ac-2569]|uniref:Nramp family divalent metal transporter n=1 Tax=Kribbella sp. VKM Ac-2569 TaxID=2512220 RepID=UPI00102CBFAF|nr:Nramp family divalent metal transporter [Kribbella sp. VKM Ac-2569]RZT28255.1 Mn2+/Fe2+ NRAMP family transporter [Kribbella sp. VKM Ac-2569]
MADTASTDHGRFALPTKNLPAPQVRDLPDPPTKTWKIIGPGMVGAGVGLASGEFILWPYISSQIGLVFLWGAVVGVVVQWFLNMEIERYTLATGETALTGFNRYGKHWGLFFAIMTYFANLWPGWATSSASMLTYLFGAGNPRWIAIVMLVVIGAILTLAPVVYVMLERLIAVKIAAVALLVVLALVFAIRGKTYGALGDAVTHPQFPAEQLGFALVMGAIAYAGAGGGQNLVQSNWIRDKGFGMGLHVPRLTSPVTGETEADPTANGYTFPPNDENLARWKRWWKFANIEQAATFVAITVVTIIFTSMLAHATLFGDSAVKNNISFLKIEGTTLQTLVGGWFGYLFWAIGAFSLFAAAAGIVDYTSRLAADMVKARYLRESKVSESKLYFWLVWGLVAFGIIVLLAGVTQPLVLLVISACTAGTMMFFYSGLLWWMNSRALPRAIRITTWRSAVLWFSFLAFGFLAVFTIIDQAKKL